MKNSIDRFMDRFLYDDDDQCNAIYRFRNVSDDDSIDFNQSFSNNERKRRFKSIPFLKRLYSTNMNRSFDEIEFNYDMTIAKERFDEAIKDTIYSSQLSKIQTPPITIDRNEVLTWITAPTTITTTQSDSIII
jgi:hypothetical protein